MDFHETWYVYHATRGHSSFVYSYTNIPLPVILTWLPCELRGGGDIISLNPWALRFVWQFIFIKYATSVEGLFL
jgi:hypothetical protein